MWWFGRFRARPRSGAGCPRWERGCPRGAWPLSTGLGRVIHRVPTRTGVRLRDSSPARPAATWRPRQDRHRQTVMAGRRRESVEFRQDRHGETVKSRNRPIRDPDGPSIGHKRPRMSILPTTARPACPRPAPGPRTASKGSDKGSAPHSSGWMTAVSVQWSGRFDSDVAGGNGTWRRVPGSQMRRCPGSSAATSTHCRYAPSGS
jgi:hypothetical protein